MANYWEKRYQQEGKIWGEVPSLSVVCAEKIFSENSVSSIHIPGCGYGRNAGFFLKAGYSVSGTEISEIACKIASIDYPELEIRNSSILEKGTSRCPADAIFAYNILHLFNKSERFRLIKLWSEMLTKNGIVFCTVFSENESSFGKGKETEKNTYESKPGRPVHYFSETDLEYHFINFKMIKSGLFPEPEDHGGEKHIHNLRYIAAKKED